MTQNAQPFIHTPELPPGNAPLHDTQSWALPTTHYMEQYDQAWLCHMKCATVISHCGFVKEVPE